MARRANQRPGVLIAGVPANGRVVGAVESGADWLLRAHGVAGVEARNLSAFVVTIAYINNRK